MPVRAISLFLLFLLITLHPTRSMSTTADTAGIKDILDRECTNLKADILFDLIKAGFPSEIEKGLSPDLLKIMEGVVKRTDFDGIKELISFLPLPMPLRSLTTPTCLRSSMKSLYTAR